MTTAAMRTFQKPKLPQSGAHPLVHFLWSQIIEQQTSQEDVAARSGVSSSAMRKWRRVNRVPRLSEIEAVLNALGFNLAVVPDDSRRPVLVVDRFDYLEG